MSISQMRKVMEEVFQRYPQVRENYKRKLIDFPKSSYDIPKSLLLIKVADDTSKYQRITLKNNLLNFIKDDSVTAFDGVTFMEDV